MWRVLRPWFKESGCGNSISRPLKVYCDNSAAVFFSKNDKYSKGAKHIEIKYLSVKEEVNKRTLMIQHIGTKFMIADPLTKGLPPKQFCEHVKNMGIVSRAEMWVVCWKFNKFVVIDVWTNLSSFELIWIYFQVLL